MKRKVSISHEAAIVEELRRDPAFAAEYLKAALDDTEEPKVLLVVLRQLAEDAGRHGEGSQGGRCRAGEPLSCDFPAR